MWSDRIFPNRTPILVALFTTIVGCGLGISKLTFNSDTRVFFDSNDVHMTNLVAFEETFQPTRKVLFAVHSEKPIELDSTKRAAVDWLSQEVLKLPDATRVDSLTTVSYPYDDGGQVSIDPYLEYICPNECIDERVSVLNDPLVVRRLISEDRKSLSVMGVFNIERDSTERLATIANAAIELKRRFRIKFPDLGVYLTGGIPVSQAYVAAGRRDISTLFAIAALMLLFTLRAILGDFKNTFLMLATALSAVVVCMGIGGWAGIELNSASSTIPIMVLTLVIASTMHLFSHYLRLCESGVDANVAARTAINANYIPILLTTLTSAVSLSSLSLISSPPVRDLGVLSAMGILAGGVLSITLTPLLLRTDQQSENSHLNSSLQRLLNSYAKYLEGGANVAFFPLVLLLIMCLGFTRLNIDDDFVAYLSERTEVRRDTNFALEHLAGPSHIELEITSKGSVFDPEFLDELKQLTDRLRDIPDVASASSLSDIMANVARAFGETEDLELLSSDALTQYFLVYELGLRAGDSASDIINFDKTKTHIPLLLRSTAASDVRAIESDVVKWLQDYAHLTGLVTGENSPVAYLSSSNIPAVLKTVVISLTLTALVLGLYFQNWRFGCNALLAITVPITCGLGAWGWISGTIGLSGTIIIAVALGVVIDDAIHLLYQQRQALEQGGSARQSTAYSIHRVGVPMVATTVLFVIGLSPLMLSDFQVNVTFAMVTCLILSISILFDLTILPRLMTWAAGPDSSEGDEVAQLP